MYYLIKNTLEECSAEQCHDASYPYVAVLTPEQWLAQSENFDMAYRNFLYSRGVGRDRCSRELFFCP